MKAKMVLNMILEAALEDGYIQRNPLKSRRLKITGEASKVTKSTLSNKCAFFSEIRGLL